MERAMITAIDAQNELVEYDSNRHRKRSIAWDHFEKLPSESKEDGKAKCKHCDTIFSSTPRSGTSHLKRHMERCSKRLAIDVEPISIDYGYNDFEGNGQSVKLGKRVSKVWNEYELFPAPNMNDAKARCKHCKMVLSAASKNGTSHLKRHLDKCSKRLIITGDIQECFIYSENLAEESSSDKFQRCVSVTSNAKRLAILDEYLPEESKPTENYQVNQDELRRYISAFIIKGAHPFSIVEEKGFRSMMSKACPHYKPFSRAIVRRELFSMYMKERDTIKEMVAKAPGRICLTISKWKARDTNDEYICVNAQFIDYQWNFVRRALCFRVLAPPYYGTYIADQLACLSSQYSIDRKAFTITVDEASYNDSMVDSIKRGLLTKKALMRGGSLFQVNCSTCILNFLAQSTLNLVGDVLDRIRELVKFINKSPIQRKKFYDLAERTFELQIRKRLSLDVLSRWNSTYKLIDHSLYYKGVFKHLVESKQELSNLSLSKEEWQKLSVVHKFLKVVYDVTHMLSANNHPTSNLFLKGMLMVHCRMMELAKGPNSLWGDAFKAMKSKFDDFWCESNLLLSCATILDPRYKIKFVEYCYMKLDGLGNVEDCVSKVVSTLYHLFAEYKQLSVHVSSPTIVSSSVNTNFFGGNDDVDMFGDYDQFLRLTSKAQGNKSELDIYLEEPSYDLNSDLDVLEFWSKSSMRYPELSVLARDLLSVPVSTADPKEAFHIGNKTLTSAQSSMAPETLQALLCVQDWLGAQDKSVEDLSGSSEDGDYDDEDDDSVLTDSF